MTRDRVLVTERQVRRPGDTIYHRPAGERTLCGTEGSDDSPLLAIPLQALEAETDGETHLCEHCANGGTANARNSSTLAHRLSELDPDAVGDDRARPDGGFCGPGDDPAVLDEDPEIRTDGSGYAGDLTDHHFLLTCGECGVLDSAHTGTRLFRDVRVAYRRAGIHEGLSGDDHRVDVESVEPATTGDRR